MRTRIIVTIMLTLISGMAAASTKVEQNGFIVQEELAINAVPQKVYEALIAKVGEWWNPQHTYSGDSTNLSIESKPGGCFCEKFPKGGGVEHMRVVFLAPNSKVVMSGALGPLQSSGLAGALTWQFTGEGSGTKLKLQYVVGGYMAGGFEKMAPAVDAMLTEQINRLKLYVEKGGADAK